MDKQAFYRYAGRDVALRAHTNDLVSEVNEKTASFNDQEIAEVNDQVGGLQYVDELQKIAESRGAARAYASVVETINDMNDPTAEKVASLAKESFEQVASTAQSPQAQNEKEAENLQDQMVQGCAEALGEITGQRPSNENVLKVAVDLVVDEIEGQQ